MEKTQEGLIFNIQKFSVNDGGGIRTIVFLNGCPLRCQWCANPESQQLTPQLMYRENLCISCGTCAKGCAAGVFLPTVCTGSGVSAAAAAKKTARPARFSFPAIAGSSRTWNGRF